MPLIKNVNELNQRIDIIETNTIRNSSGGMVEKTDIVIYSCWAQVRNAKYRDYYNNLATETVAQLTFIIRFNPDVFITKNMKIKWKNKIFTVSAINGDFQDKEWTTIIASDIIK